MKVYDYKKTLPGIWCLVLCMSFFSLTLSAQVPDMACASQVNVAVGSDCMLDIEPGLFTEGTEDFIGAPIHFSTYPSVTSSTIGSDVDLPCGMYTFTIEASGNSCWGTVKVEDKLPPVLNDNPCPVDAPCITNCLTVLDTFQHLLSNFPLIGGGTGNFFTNSGGIASNIYHECTEPITPLGTNYGVASEEGYLWFNKITLPSPSCDSTDIHWIINYKDGKGNKGADTIAYRAGNIGIATIITPENYVGDCGEDDFVDPDDSGIPSVIGMDGSTIRAKYLNFDLIDGVNKTDPTGLKGGNAQVCNLLISFWDIKYLPVSDCRDDMGCGSSKKVVREWTYINWCADENGYDTGIQLIELKDTTGPMVRDKDYEFSTDPWKCAGEFTITVTAKDDCADAKALIYDLTGPAGVSITNSGQPGDSVFHLKHVPPGMHLFQAYAYDCCDNVSPNDVDGYRGEITIWVIDDIKPFAIAKEFTVASVVETAEGDDAITKVYWNSIDNGSWDACSDLHYFVRRMDGDPNDCDDKDFFPYELLESNKLCSSSSKTYDRATAISWAYDFVECHTVPHDDKEPMSVTVVQQPTVNGDFAISTPGWACPDDEIDNHCNLYGEVQYNGDEWGEFVKFCCADFEGGEDVDGDGYANEFRVELLVFDGEYNWNITWGWVKIEDPNPPTLVTDPYHAYCHDEVLNGPISEAVDRIAEDAFDEDLVYAFGTCDNEYDVEQGEPFDIWYDPTCKYGSFYIPYTVTGFKGYNVRGVQKVFIYYKDDFSCDNIHGWTLDEDDDWYDDADNYDFRDNLSAECDPIDPPALTWDAGPCELIGWTLKTDTFYFETDACRKIINEWTVIDWCVYDVRNDKTKRGYLREHWYEFDLIRKFYDDKGWGKDDPKRKKERDDELYCDSDEYWYNDGDTHDPDIEPVETTYPPFDPDQGGYLDFPYEINVPNWRDGIYKWTQLIKVSEDDAPIIEPFDGDLVVDSFLVDCGIDLDLTICASDLGECPADWLKWDLFEIDKIGGDVIKDFDRSDYELSDDGCATWEGVFESNNEPWDTKYFRVKAWDGCGNVDIYEFQWDIFDRKAPTPYCINLSTALMVDPDGDGPYVPMVELWACDFDLGSFDNCTPDWKLFFTFDGVPPAVDFQMNKVDIYEYEQYYTADGLLMFYDDVSSFRWEDETGAAVSSSERDAIMLAYNTGDDDTYGGEIYRWLPRHDSECGKYTAGKVYTEDEIANGDTDGDGNVDVQMDVWDEELNVDYCSVQLTLRCATCGNGGPVASVAGSISTEAGSDVAGVEVTLDNLTNPEYTLTDVTGNDGAYAFASNPMYNGYDITGVKSGDDDEGVSTLDLVMIQRHILGLASFTSPYKVIASDINNNGDVSATDLIVLRKVILGLYKEFPQNESWRFVDAKQNLTVENALENFSEVLNIAELDANMLNENFVAVKIGDVNGDAKTNARSTGPQVRNANKVALSIEDRNVQAGELVDITFGSEEFNQVYGYQFTIELNGLQFEAVKAGAANMTDDNVALLDANTLTVSYADINGLSASDNIFTLSVVANRAGAISEMIDINSNTLNSEAYIGTSLDVATVELTLEGQEVAAFELGQNEPNPFNDFTVVGFTLPEAGDAQITVYDVAGKVITSKFGAYAKGYNTERFTKNELGVSGVLYYTLESGEFTATKKMIIIE